MEHKQKLCGLVIKIYIFIGMFFSSCSAMESGQPTMAQTELASIVVPKDVLGEIAKHLIKKEVNPEAAIRTVRRFFQLNRAFYNLLKNDSSLCGELITCLYEQFVVLYLQQKVY